MNELSKLKKAIVDLESDISYDSVIDFSNVLDSYISSGTLVEWPGITDNNGHGRRFRIVESNGKHYAAMFSDHSEARLAGGERVFLTDINEFIGPVFQDSHIDGIIIDPDSASFRLDKSELLQCVLHDSYRWYLPERTKVVPHKDWGKGIPDYSKEDLMTDEEIQELAIQTVLQKEYLLQQGCKIISTCPLSDEIPSIPSIIAEKNGCFHFIYIETSMKKPTLRRDIVENDIRSIGIKFNAECWWASVDIRSNDPERAEACLALKGDRFNCKYAGLDRIWMERRYN